MQHKSRPNLTNNRWQPQVKLIGRRPAPISPAHRWVSSFNPRPFCSPRRGYGFNSLYFESDFALVAFFKAFFLLPFFFRTCVHFTPRSFLRCSLTQYYKIWKKKKKKNSRFHQCFSFKFLILSHTWAFRLKGCSIKWWLVSTTYSQS